MYDKMTDEELVIMTFKLLGYKRLFPIKDPHWWNKGRCGKSTLEHPITHDLAAEVKQHMMDRRDEKGRRKWDCNDYWAGGPRVCFSAVFECEDVGCAPYNNMDEYPRAVCIAALKALNA